MLLVIRDQNSNFTSLSFLSVSTCSRGRLVFLLQQLCWKNESTFIPHFLTTQEVLTFLLWKIRLSRLSCLTLPGASPRAGYSEGLLSWCTEGQCCFVRGLPTVTVMRWLGKNTARRLVLCLMLPVVPLYFSHECNFLLMMAVYLLHTDTNVQRNVCVNIETMLRNVLNIARVPEGR